jgi:hypothetical protein
LVFATFFKSMTSTFLAFQVIDLCATVTLR